MVGIFLFAIAAPPSGTASDLIALESNKLVASVFLGLDAIRFILYMFGFVCLYYALSATSRGSALLATILGVLGPAIELAVTITSQSAQFGLADAYASSTTDVQRAAIVAASEFGAGVTSAGVGLNTAITIAAVLVFSVLILRGRTFPRWTGLFGVVLVAVNFVAGLASGLGGGVGSVAGFIGLPAYLALLLVWIPAVGYRLYRLGR